MLVQQVAVGSVGGGAEHIQELLDGVFQYRRGCIEAGAQFLEYLRRLSADFRHLRVDGGVAQVGAPGHPQPADAAAQVGAEIRGRRAH